MFTQRFMDGVKEVTPQMLSVIRDRYQLVLFIGTHGCDSTDEYYSVFCFHTDADVCYVKVRRKL